MVILWAWTGNTLTQSSSQTQHNNCIILHQHEKAPLVGMCCVKKSFDRSDCCPLKDGTIPTIYNTSMDLVEWQKGTVGTKALLFYSRVMMLSVWVVPGKYCSMTVMAQIQYSEFIAGCLDFSMRNSSVRLFWLLDWSGVEDSCRFFSSLHRTQCMMGNAQRLYWWK